jgi:type I restriction enzyme S subunit
MREGYKKTEIGEIPEEWEVKKFGEIILNYIKGKNPKSLKIIKTNKNDYVYLSAEYMRTKNNIKYCDKNGAIYVDKDDILLLWDGSNAGEIFMGFSGILSSTMAKLLFNENVVEKKFVYYLLRQKEKEVKSTRKGTGIPHVNADSLKNIKIAVPPLPEQQKIAEILSTVDEGIEVCDKKIEKLERYKKGKMQQLLTKGIGHKKFKKSEIGEIPEEWEVVELGNKNYFNIETGGTPETTKKEYWNNGSIFWATPKDLTNKYLIKTERKITEVALQNSNVTIVPEDSIIISTRAPIGLISIAKKSTAFNQGCKALIIKNSSMINSDFLYYAMLTNIKNMQNVGAGSTFKEISKDNLERIKLKLPSIKEQQKIAEILATIDELIELEKQKKEKLEKYKKGLMNDLLTGRKRVKIN